MCSNNSSDRNSGTIKRVQCKNAGLPNLIVFNVFMFVITLLQDIMPRINKIDYELKIPYNTTKQQCGQSMTTVEYCDKYCD